MEYKLIMAVSGFPSLYDTTSLTYRDLNMRSDAWRQVAEIVGVPESECRRKWKTLRDQHRRERQREKERRESGVGLFNYRPWRYSSILSFLNPFIDARAAGTNGWALDPQPSHVQPSDMMVGCSTTTEPRSDDDDTYGFAVADATTTSSSSSSEFVHRKRPSSANMDVPRLKETKMEVNSDATVAAAAAAVDDRVQTQQQANIRELFEMMMHSVTSLASSLASSHSSSQPTDQLIPHVPLDPQPRRSSPSWTASRLNQLKAEEQEGEVAELLVQSDEEEEVEEVEEEECRRAKRRRRRRSGVELLLEEFLRRTEAREVQRDVDQRDDVMLFLLSLAPALRRLDPEKQSWVRTRMQQLVHQAEFGASDFQ